MRVKAMMKWLGIGFLVIFLVVAYQGVGLYHRSGAGLTLENKWVDQCHKVTIAPGAEDIHYDPDTGLGFISADNRFISHKPLDFDTELGLIGNGIYVVDFTPDNIKDIGNARRVSPDNLIGFRPHGLYLWKGENQKRLFVVNHKTFRDHVEEVVEIFDVAEDGDLSHLESISFPEMTNPNDVVAVGPRQFYATNFLRYHDGNQLFYEVLMAPAYSYVLYFDGEQGRVTAEGLSAANGLGISPDGKTLYAMEWNQRRIAVFDRQADNNLTLIGKIKLPTLADNVNVDDAGTLWIAGQPKLFEAIDFRLGKRQTASSLAAKVDPKTHEVDTVFVSTKGELNNASSAEVAGNKLVIGSVNDEFITVCQRPN